MTLPIVFSHAVSMCANDYAAPKHHTYAQIVAYIRRRYASEE